MSKRCCPFLERKNQEGEPSQAKTSSHREGRYQHAEGVPRRYPILRVIWGRGGGVGRKGSCSSA
eukprot:1095816-Pyramimonas_sp.AAC.1